MFELGLRLAFDKPVIIIKDHDTGYSFDTSMIEHLNYSKELPFHETEKFINKLTDKINATLEKSKEQNYSPFLKHFTKIKAVGLLEKEGSPEQVISAQIKNMQRSIDLMMKNMRPASYATFAAPAMSERRLEQEVRRIIRGLLFDSDVNNSDEAYRKALDKCKALGLDVSLVSLRILVDEEIQKVMDDHNETAIKQ